MDRKSNSLILEDQARLLDLAHDAILAQDMDGTIVYWNDSAARLYGWTAAEALGQNVGQLLQQDEGRSVESRKALLEKDRWSDELTHAAKDGQKVLVESRLTLVRDQQGRPKSVLAINTDITEWKKMQAQSLRSQRMESVGTLASGMAHDLNNVLAPIMMSCQLLSAYAVEPEEQQLLEVISHSARRGADLVNQILSFCRGAEGRRMQLQIKSLILEVSHIIRETFPKNIRFETRLGEDLWPIVADPTQMHQVLLNLCVNARDAMPNGGVLTVEAQNIMPDGLPPGSDSQSGLRPLLLLVVTDTGVGIPPEIREKIFDPFFTTKETGKGTGLGLSTSLGIVKSHSGFINVYSEPGAGTSFKVYLPALAVASAVALEAAEAQLPRGNGELVLVVDDEAAVRTITSQTLQAYGYTVLTACDGAQAVKSYSRHAHQVAVILMDMMMPVMDGPSTIHLLSHRYPDLKVIAVSGLSAETHMAKMPSAAVKAFLPKPYTAGTLLLTLHEVLGSSVTSGPPD